MSEPTVQVRVSLIERALTSMMTERYDNTAARELEALLSQPTPTAEQIETLRNLACDGSGVCQSPLHVHGCHSDIDGTACDEPAEHPTAEPPRIEGLAPGTTFVAQVRFLIDSHGTALPHTGFDPSTIRDVREPA